MTELKCFATKSIGLQSDLRLNLVLSGPDPASSKSPTVFFLHFWGGSSAVWSRVTSLLPPEWPTAALDFRGWGASVGPDDAGAYSIAHLAADVEAAIASLEPQKVVLVGMSMGGKVAQAVAGRGRVGSALRGVLLVGPAPPTPLVLPGEMREQQVHAYDSAQSAEFVARHVLTSPRSGLGDDAYEAMVRDMLGGNRWAREAWPAYAMAEDVVELARRIVVPVVVLGGENDLVEPVERLRSEVVGNIGGAKMIVLPGAGHMVPLEKPAEVAREIKEFVDRHATRTPEVEEKMSEAEN
ncbi:alpha beta-hydrolase [Diplogelasinospora grovesii]|uniref:Alpha beta-hydrolase n=1 Tax=Diplogelasinospora grovesii TaxID=303347 RepID=A0AAN6N4M9_9PEZI|nr:alpha beta-hydrolase [Diplogelasinospora grovesii]